MLENTFCHTPGIGLKTEHLLWEAGYPSWESVLDASRLPLSPEKTMSLKRRAEESCRHLAAGNVRFFADHLPSHQLWRLFPDFQHKAAFLDIETTGLDAYGNHITTIALFDGRAVRCYVWGRNLHEFEEDISNHDLLITYNGKCFDAPFITADLGIEMDQAHIDLRYVLSRLGYRGGLKGCEKAFGLGREELEGVDGFFAVLLWHDYRKNGNPAALDTLLAYNVADTVNLAVLMRRAYNLKLKDTPFERTHRLPEPELPDIPFKPDMETVARLRGNLYSGSDRY